MKGVENHIDIKKFLPHRTPMLMVDNILSIDEENVTATFTIAPSCIFIKNNKFTECGLIENAAQTCSTIVGRGFFDEDDTEGEKNQLIGFISAVKSATILSLPTVGSQIITKSSLVSRFDADNYSICTMKCEIACEGELVANCVMNLFIQEVAR